MTTIGVRLSTLFLAAAVVLGATAGVPSAAAADSGTGGPGTGAGPGVIPVDPPMGAMVAGAYIVSLEAGVDAADLAGDVGVSPRYVYSTALDGFAARLNQDQLSDLQRTPGVAAIEHDQVYRSAAGGTAVAGTAVADAAVQDVPAGGGLYGLDRIDQRALPLSGTYTSHDAGTTVYAYVLDELIDTSHPDFGGRAVNVFSTVASRDIVTSECADHGTHVAGTLGGATYGVAKTVQLRGVRVLDCNGAGTVSGIIAAVDWVRANAERPAVANLSLGGDHSPALNAAVTELVQSGVSVAVAAGNEKRDACLTSPASADGVVTVAASTRADGRATSFSNWGRCVDLYAPGVDITSTAPGGRTKTFSGTSMAAPHVAGAMALYKAGGERRSSQVSRWLLRHASAGVVRDNVPGTPNRLLHVPG